MNIGEAEKAIGLAAKTMRYYEDIGLVVPARADNGYRDYSLVDIHRLRFIQRARGLGFSVEDCRGLLALWDDTARSSRDVKRIALEQLELLSHKIKELETLRTALGELVDHCRGDDRPQCPIIDDLAGTKATCVVEP